MTDFQHEKGHGDFEFDTSCPTWIKAGMANPKDAFWGLLGYEADRIFHIASYTDRTWSKVSESVFLTSGGPSPSHAVYYKMNTSGARVFAAGTIQWAWGLDSFGSAASYPTFLDRPNIYDPDVEVVTRNILGCLKNGGSACGE